MTKDFQVLHLNTVLETLPLGFDPKYSKTYTPYTMDLTTEAYTDGRMWGGSSGHNGLQAYRERQDCIILGQASPVAVVGFITIFSMRS